MRFAILALLILSGCADKQTPSHNSAALTAETYPAVTCTMETSANSYSALKTYIITLRPQLANEHDKQVIERTIRDLAYVEFTFGRGQQAELMEPDIGFKKLVEDKTYSYHCWGISFMYRQALQAFGIETRRVGLLRDINPTYSHATSEIKLNGKWVVSDATFNIELTDNKGNRIGYQEAWTNGFNIVRGIHNLAGKDLDHWEFSDAEFISYMNYVAVYPGPYETNHVYLPSTWDGYVVSRIDGPILLSLDESKALRILNQSFAEWMSCY